MQGYAHVQTPAPERAVLSNGLHGHSIGPERQTLSDLISAMSDADVARTFAIADQEVTMYRPEVESDLGLQIFACEEDAP